MAKDVKVLKQKWVLSIKGVYNLYKARLSAKGFTQHFGEDYDETFATVRSTLPFARSLHSSSREYQDPPDGRQ